MARSLPNPHAQDMGREEHYLLMDEQQTPQEPGIFKDGLWKGLVIFSQTHFPPLRWLPKYRVSEYLQNDCLGGLTIGLVCLAQTLAHSAIATTNSIQGPYTAFIPTLVYGLLGTSPHASVSSGAIAAMIIAEQVAPWPDIQDRTELASFLALISGVTLLIMGIGNFAFAVRFLSTSTLSGFISGGAILIAAQQLKNFLGFQAFPHTHGFPALVEALITHIGEADLNSIFVGCLIYAFLEVTNNIKKYAGRKKLVLLRRFTEAKEIIAVIIGITIGYFTADHNGNPIMTVVGEIPAGLPPFRLPWNCQGFKDLMQDQELMTSFIFGGVMVALTSFLTTYATAKKLAVRFNYPLEASQELVALGMAGIGGSCYGAFAPSGSLSRTGLAAECGIKTQLGGAFAAIVIGLGLSYLTPIIFYLPKACLAAIIIKSSINLIDFNEALNLAHYWRPAHDGGLKQDLVIWCIAFFGTVFKGALMGIAISVVVSIVLIIKDAAVPSAVILGCVESLGNKWRNIQDWPEAQSFPGILVFEFRGSLTFVSAEHFQEELEKSRHISEERWGSPVKIVVISLSSVHRIDATALKMLEELLKEWHSNQISCIVSGAKHQVRLLVKERLHDDRIAQKLPSLLDQHNFIVSKHEAVELAKKRLQAHQEAGERGIVNVRTAEEESRTLNVFSSVRRIKRASRSRNAGDALPDMDPETKEAARRMPYKSTLF